MSARAECSPLSWKATEQSRRNGHVKNGGEVQSARLSTNGEHAAFTLPLTGSRSGRAQRQWNTLLKRRDRLRIELQRGKEYLEQLRQEMAAARARVEDWTEYENQCGRNPLPDLLESLLVHERTVQFLSGWIKRQEHKLAAATTEMCVVEQQSAERIQKKGLSGDRLGRE